MQPPKRLRPGERLFALLLLAFAAFVFSEAFGISGLRGLTTGGVMPMLASGVMVVSAVFILRDTLRRPVEPSVDAAAILSHLAPLRVLVFAGLVVAYALLIPRVGFLAASGLFLLVSIWGLWRRGVFRAVLVSGGAVVGIYLLFRVIFQVVLPVGSLWR